MSDQNPTWKNIFEANVCSLSLSFEILLNESGDAVAVAKYGNNRRYVRFNVRTRFKNDIRMLQEEKKRD